MSIADWRTAGRDGLFGEEYFGGRVRARCSETADIDPGRAEAAGSVAAVPGQGIGDGGRGTGDGEDADEAARGVEDRDLGRAASC